MTVLPAKPASISNEFGRIAKRMTARVFPKGLKVSWLTRAIMNVDKPAGHKLRNTVFKAERFHLAH